MKKWLFIISAMFLLSSCMTKVIKKENATSLPQKPIKTVWTTAYVFKDQVALRKGPGKHFPVIAYLSDGDQVRVLGNQKGWYQISTDDNRKGWVRSSQVGPRYLSRTAMAAAFNDSVMNHFSARLYIDKHQPYKVIYLETNLRNISKAKKLARTIGRAYQKKVYPGKVTINLIHPGQKKYFAQVILKPIGVADFPMPVVEYGYLDKITVKHKTVRLIIRVPAGLSKQTLLKLARKISSAYSYPYTKSEIIVRPFPKSQSSKKCLLYYIEDEYGEDYSFGHCKL